MFTEPNSKHKKKGWIEVICGSMFSGKTEELIRRLKRAQYAHLRVAIYKPALDNRYDAKDIVSHEGVRITSTPVPKAADIQPDNNAVDIIGIDEAQFFDMELIEVVKKLALQGIRVICAGLDMDFNKKGFGPMPELMAQADYITKLQAICMVCGDSANYSYRKTANDATIVLGEKDVYEARCRICFERNDLKQRTIF